MKKVLFVCLGNICRSPLAEAVFNYKSQKKNMLADSAGTAAYHIGSQPDERSIQVASDNGIPISHQARQFTSNDFKDFDYVIAMDRDNYKNMLSIAEDEVDNLYLMRDFDDLALEDSDKDVPDPYYGGFDGFQHIYDIIDRSVDNLIDHIESHP